MLSLCVYYDLYGYYQLATEAIVKQYRDLSCHSFDVVSLGGMNDVLSSVLSEASFFIVYFGSLQTSCSFVIKTVGFSGI